ncbi:MAG: hypothetical protein KDC44_10810, partial [Phaeodactylibacter sp.]|nr:hypothetical protein [Phaeodactylibacter sp.]
MRILLLLFCLYVHNLWGQQNPLAFFEPLMGHTWVADGSWGDGSAFRQEVEFEYALEGMIVLAHSKGFTNEAQNAYGPRNHGIRKYDP